MSSRLPLENILSGIVKFQEQTKSCPRPPSPPPLPPEQGQPEPSSSGDDDEDDRPPVVQTRVRFDPRITIHDFFADDDTIISPENVEKKLSKVIAHKK